MTELVTDAMMAEAVTAAGFSMADVVSDGPAALASPSYKALESRSVVTAGAFVKRMHPEMRGTFHLGAALQAARNAGAAGVGPEVLWSDEGLGAIAMNRLGNGWITARQNDLQTEAVMTSAVKALKTLHAGPALDHRFDPFAEIDHLIAAYKADGLALPDNIGWLRRLVWMAKGLSDSAALRPCRNDGSCSNLMIGPGAQVMLVDFDRAGMNDPLYDLGCLLAELTDHESEMRPAFEAYVGHFDPVGFARARLWSHVDDMLHALWSGLMAHKSERTSVEWIKYGEWRLLRLTMALQHPLFEERVRQTAQGAA
ncbi:MAG: phosphotransferase [Pseudotabrizicola sp.]|uniref:phosphotransferase n=1 Tax=Pseudotabrizicola sp. TaxID=2939647 RepID=UPI00271AA6DF|nr:phosphotransferase [Pseudotabrizicola sp.]MDO9640990.1 phosphotransferase [Pseudotabrizicola sp.]